MTQKEDTASAYVGGLTVAGICLIIWGPPLLAVGCGAALLLSAAYIKRTSGKPDAWLGAGLAGALLISVSTYFYVAPKKRWALRDNT